MLMRGVFTTCLFTCISFVLFGQQFSQWTQYRDMTASFNPAAISKNYLYFDYGLNFNLNHRTQWVNIEDAPKTQIFNVDWMLSNSNALLGGQLINDQSGATGFTGGFLRFAYILGDVDDWGISVGLQAGMVQYRIRLDGVEFRDQVNLDSETLNQWYPDFGLGVYYYQFLNGRNGDDLLFAGISIPQTLGLDLTFSDTNNDFNTKRVQHFYGFVGWRNYVYENGFIEPTLRVSYVPNAPVNIGINVKAQLVETFWIGVGGATSRTFHGEFGLMIGEIMQLDNTDIRFGYSYDYSFNSYGAFFGGSHELSLMLSIDNAKH